jgi:ATP-binding cassette subfamily B protein
VPQQAVLFSGSIADNLRWGKPDASEEELTDALKTAQAYDFVSKLGLDYMIEEGGKNFSGGQRQRLTIARALVSKPSVVILDDSLSALDYRTDANLRAALENNLDGTTVVIISQRISSVMGADKILVLDDGAQAGLGTHDELLKGCSEYRELYETQAEGGDSL